LEGFFAALRVRRRRRWQQDLAQRSRDHLPASSCFQKRRSTPSWLPRSRHAVLAASIFHFGTYSVGEAKHYMSKCGIDMRLD